MEAEVSENKAETAISISAEAFLTLTAFFF